MIIRVMTLFPEMFEGPLGTSIMKRAQEKKLIDIECLNIRDFSNSRHKKVDDYPYGGGAGMVMTPQPIFDCHDYIQRSIGEGERIRTVYLSPKGRTFSQEMANELSKENKLILLCGHYEGVDQRVIDALVTDEISIGDYVLTGGEIPALTIIDAVARLIPGVLSQNESYEDESFYGGLLEYPHYTRPSSYRGLEVPDVLLSGNHQNIEQWRRKKSLEITLKRRPDLIQKVELSPGEKRWLEELKKEIK